MGGLWGVGHLRGWNSSQHTRSSRKQSKIKTHILIFALSLLYQCRGGSTKIHEDPWRRPYSWRNELTVKVLTFFLNHNIDSERINLVKPCQGLLAVHEYKAVWRQQTVHRSNIPTWPVKFDFADSRTRKNNEERGKTQDINMELLSHVRPQLQNPKH